MPVYAQGGVQTSIANLSGGSTGTIPYQSAANTTAMLAPGTSNYVLMANGAAAPAWVAAAPRATLADLAAAIAAGSAGSLLYQSAPGVTNSLSTGTTGQI